MNIYEKLAAIQNELKVPKNLTNKFGGYNYRNAEAIYEELKPLLKKYKCVLVMDNFPQPIDGRDYMDGKAILFDCESDQQIEVHAYAEMEREKKGMSLAQISGAAISYANKYACGNMFLLDDTKDADSEEYKTAADEKAKRELVVTEENKNDKIKKEEVELLKAEAKRTGTTPDFLKKHFGVKSISELTTVQYQAAMDKMVNLPTVEEETK